MDKTIILFHIMRFFAKYPLIIILPNICMERHLEEVQNWLSPLKFHTTNWKHNEDLLSLNTRKSYDLSLPPIRYKHVSSFTIWGNYKL